MLPSPPGGYCLFCRCRRLPWCWVPRRRSRVFHGTRETTRAPPRAAPPARYQSAQDSHHRPRCFRHPPSSHSPPPPRPGAPAPEPRPLARHPPPPRHQRGPPPRAERTSPTPPAPRATGPTPANRTRTSVCRTLHFVLSVIIVVCTVGGGTLLGATAVHDSMCMTVGVHSMRSRQRHWGR